MSLDLKLTGREHRDQWDVGGRPMIFIWLALYGGENGGVVYGVSYVCFR